MKVRAWIVIVLCMTASCMQAAPKKGKPATSATYAEWLKKHPGDSNTYCSYVRALLTEGDTTTAEQKIAAMLKIDEANTCMLRSKAAIALARGKQNEAVRCAADAVAAGWQPETDDTLLVQMVQTCGEALGLRLSLAARQEKTNTNLWRARAVLALLQADTVTALAHYTTARQLGDTTLNETIAALRTVEQLDSSRVRYRIPFTRTFGAYELHAKCNGLPIKIVMDTAATINTISGVESLFLLKNDYITQKDIIQDTQVLMRSVEIGEQVVLRDVLFHNKNGQETPLILSLRAFDHLGKPVLNTNTNTIDIYEINNQQITE